MIENNIKQTERGYIQIQSTELFYLENEIAGFGSRAFAYLIDFGIKAAGLTLLILLIGSLKDSHGRLVVGYLTFLSLLFIGYHFFFEAFFHGRTPGKRIAGIRVVRLDGTRISLLDSLVRNVLRIVDFLPVGYFVAFFVMFFEKHNRRFGDLVADTVVIYSRPPEKSLRQHVEALLAVRRSPGKLVFLGIEKLTEKEKQIAKDLYLRLDKVKGSQKREILEAFYAKLAEKIQVIGEHDPECFLRELNKHL